MKRLDAVFLIVVIVAVVFVGWLGARSAAGGSLPAFDPALESWTAWVASVIAMIISARVLWEGAVWLHSKIKR